MNADSIVQAPEPEVPCFEVQSFGLDCLGNPTGWAVVDAGGFVLATFVASLYDPEARAAARRDAHELVRLLKVGGARLQAKPCGCRSGCSCASGFDNGGQ
jgi:hypothetical protein